MKTNMHFDNLFLKSALQDSQQAFKELFFEFYPALCVFASQYVSCEETAKDIVQDAFCKIWANRKKIKIDTSFRNFLITTVHNNCIDSLRKQDIAHRYMGKKDLSETPASPEEIYTLSELESMIRTALAKLPPKIRQSFEMSRLKGMSYNEIAEEMSLSPKTIEAYISKALKILRHELKDYLPFLFMFL